MDASRRRNRGRTRILYWFRTPPGVRVGRAPLDEDAIRMIEEHHPSIEFDWPQILNGEEEPAPPPQPRTQREPPPPRRADPPQPAPVEAAPIAAAPPIVEEPTSPAHARLGSEGLARLRARYAQVLAAISRRVPDEARRETLKAEAERLNPDVWVTDDEVTTGLEQYESVLASFRDVVGHRRRRRGGRSNRQGPAGEGGTPSAEEMATGEETSQGSDDGPDEPDDEAGSGN